MPPKPGKRMTAHPARPKRYFPGKAYAESEPESSASDEEPEPPKQQKPAPKPSLPKATSFPKRDAAALAEARRKEAERLKALEDEFETESEGEAASGQEGSESEEESGDEEDEEDEESSSEDDIPRPTLLRPVFMRKDQRGATNGSAPKKPEKTADELWEEEEARRKARATAVVQEQLEKRAAERAAGKKEWDDEDVNAIEDVDDTDDVKDLEADLAAWKLRELERVNREREEIIAAEKELEETERRKNLTEEERAAEDREKIERQREEREGKGKIDYLQKYYHKGAFFQDDAEKLGLDKRDVMGAKFQDQVDRSTLPQYMQMRDLNKLGKKGATRYRDMKSEDTGRFGDYVNEWKGGRRDYGGDYGSRSDFGRDRDRDRGPTGANASSLGERKRFGERDDRDRDFKRSRIS